jgi:type I restriction enzyme S subunit
MAGEWPMVSVSQVAIPVLGGTPSRKIPDYWGGSIKWASAKDVTSAGNRYIYNTEEAITEKGLHNSAAKILPKGTVVITARGTVGVLVQLGCDMSFNQTCYGLIPKNEVLQDYLYYALRGSLSTMRSLTYGTVFETITMKTFDQWQIPLPSILEQQAIACILGRWMTRSS